MKFTICAVAVLATVASANFAKTCEAPIKKREDTLHGLCMNLAFLGVLDIPNFLVGGKFLSGPLINQRAQQVPEEAEQEIIAAAANAGFSLEQASSGVFGDVISTNLDADSTISQVGTVNQGAGSFDISAGAQATGGVALPAIAGTPGMPPIPGTAPIPGTSPIPGMPATTTELPGGAVSETFGCPSDTQADENGECQGTPELACFKVQTGGSGNPMPQVPDLRPNGPCDGSSANFGLRPASCPPGQVSSGDPGVTAELLEQQAGNSAFDGLMPFTCTAAEVVTGRNCATGEILRQENSVFSCVIVEEIPAVAPVPGSAPIPGTSPTPGTPGTPGRAGRDAELGTATSDITFDISSNGSQSLADLLFKQTAQNAPYVVPANGTPAPRPPPATTNLSSKFSVSNANPDAGTSASAGINFNASTSGTTTSQEGKANASADSGRK